MDVYPNNKPSEYQVQLNPPLRLEGDWLVGVENVCYHSAIGNVDEKERITLTASTYEEVPLNDDFNFPYKLTQDGKWNYEWIQLDSDYYGDSDLGKMRDTLNSGNRLIMKDETMKVYAFSVYHWHGKLYYKFQSFSSGFTLRVNSDLALHLGFGRDENLFSTRVANHTKVDKTGQINPSHYKVKIFDSNVVECEERIILKKRDETALSLKSLVECWNKTVGKKYGETAQATSDTFNILKKNDKLTIAFSPSLHHVIKHYGPLIGSGSFEGNAPYLLSKEAKDEWYVEIYGDRIKKQRKYHDYYSVINTSPRQFSTVDVFIRKINAHLTMVVKKQLRDKYEAALHHISFSIKSQKTVLKLGSQMKCHLTDNLMKLFGFAHHTFYEPYTTSVETPMTLDKREQHLYIQSDLIQAVAFGDKKEYIMRDFIHDKDNSFGIMEKLFEPILYHPVVKQTIPTISIRITNGLHECIHLRDTKTLVTLIFRKAK